MRRRTVIVVLGAMFAMALGLLLSPPEAKADAWACNIATAGGHLTCNGHNPTYFVSSNRTQVRAVSGSRWPYTYVSRIYPSGPLYGSAVGPFSDDAWHTSTLNANNAYTTLIDDMAGSGTGYYYANHWYQGAGLLALGSGGDVPALEFDSGVTYPEALRSMFIAAQTGGVPVGSHRAVALPEGKAVALAGARSAGLVVSTKAPLGYTTHPASQCPSRSVRSAP